jgi:hypothetical protein
VATNWLIVLGLQKHGYDDVAAAIVERTRQLVEREGFREFYSPYSGRPAGASGFGWSTLAVDMLALRQVARRGGGDMASHGPRARA